MTLRYKSLEVCFVALFVFPGLAAAQYVAVPPPVHAIYPSGGQSTEQLQTDRTECQSWATQQSGVDLNRLPPSPTGQVPDNGRAFSIVISEVDAGMTETTVGDGFALVATGDCIPAKEPYRSN